MSDSSSRSFFSYAILAVVFCGVLSLTAISQVPSVRPNADDDILRIDSKLMQLDAIVKDKKGNIVKDLTAADFELLQDGKPTPIEFFSFVPITSEGSKQNETIASNRGVKAAEIKRSLVFLISIPNVRQSIITVSRSGSDFRTVSYQRLSMESLQNSVKFLNKFISESLMATDLVSINETEVNMGPLSNFTNDRDFLLTATGRLGSNMVKGPYAIQNVTTWIRDGNITWDAGDLIQQNLNTLQMAESAVDQLQRVPGRKLVFLLSRGMLGDSGILGTDIIRERLQRLIEKSNRAGVTFYSLSLRTLGEMNPPPGVYQGYGTLSDLAEKTGGRMVSNTNDLSVGLKEILQENSAYYQIAFVPSEGGTSKERRIVLRAKRPGFTVQHRASGYQNPAAGATDPNARILDLLNLPFTSDDVKIQLVNTYRALTKKTGTITSSVKIDPDALRPLQLPTGFREITVNLGIRVVEPDNHFARSDVKRFTLKLSEESWELIRKEGLVYQFETATRKEGSYLVKVAVCVSDSVCGNTEALVKSK